MKLFSKIMSRKPDPKETLANMDLDMDGESPVMPSEPTADDSGDVNASATRENSRDPLMADPDQPIYPREEEPEEVAGAGWGDSAWEEDWDDDEDWGDEELDEEPAAASAQKDKEHLVDEIREAMGAVSHIEPDDAPEASQPRERTRSIPNWSDDEEFGRKAIARNHLGGRLDGAEDRLLHETNTKLTDEDSSRRRSAMAHLKAAAAATKADRVLKHVVGRDPATDLEAQSPYRDDLAKVVRPRSTSRPISRPVSKPGPRTADWDKGPGDEDAARFAAASEESLMPGNGSGHHGAHDDIGDPDQGATPDRQPAEGLDAGAWDGGSGEGDEPGDDFPASRFATSADLAADAGDSFPRDDFADDPEGDRPVSEADWSNRFADDDDEGFEDSFDNVFEDDGDGFAMDDDMTEDPADAEFGGVEPAEAADGADGPVPSSVVSDVVAEANAPHGEDEPIEDDIVRRKIAEVSGDSGLVRDANSAASNEEAEPIVNVAGAVAGRAGRTAGRVKTRLLGFQVGDPGTQDVFEAARSATANQTQFPVGWIIVIDGPGRGTCFTLFNGASSIGRGEDQAVRLDFGDTSISRNNHAAVAFDDEQRKFFLGHGGKSNLVRLNGKPVLSTEELSNGDQIRIGETTLKFVALCGADFTWATDEDEGSDD